MINAIISGFMTFLQSTINLLLAPIDILCSNLMPNLSKYINMFNNFLDGYIPNTLAWVNNLLPPITQELLGIYLTLMIGLASTILAVHTYVFIYHIIQKIKLW